MEPSANSRSERLIRRQLRKSSISQEMVEQAGLGDFLALVESTYDEFARHSNLAERSTRLASLELTATIASLTASEKLFRSLARCSPNGIIYTDAEGRCRYANQRAEELSGYSAEELMGYGWFERVHDDDKHYFRGLMRAKVENEAVDWVAEHRYLRADGETIWVSTRMSEVDIHADGPRQGIGWVVVVEDITERRTHERELSKLARLDSLTELSNRRSLSQQLEQIFHSLPPDHTLAVAVIDLDRFKLINDTFGHDAGDSLLVAVAAKLQLLALDGDVVARLGGDEFAFVTALTPEDTAEEFAETISTVLHGMINFGDRCAHMGASIGVAVAPAGSGDSDVLLRDADTAMYRAKRSSMSRWQVFNESFRAEVSQRFLMESELRGAILNDVIQLAYQPIADLQDYQVVGVEALARWNNPRIGSVSPAEFIPMAEDLGLTATMGAQLLNQACAQLRHWRTTMPALQELNMSVNTSPLQLQDPNFPEIVRKALAKNQLPENALMIEVTESVVVEHHDTSFQVLQELRAIGVSIAIDDFGTGYSALSYLDRLPVDYLKIDKSFVLAMNDGESGEGSSRLTEAIIELALRFGLTPIAEGVETEHQRQVLLDAGCSLFQGHIFNGAMFPDDEQLEKLFGVPQLAFASGLPPSK